MRVDAEYSTLAHYEILGVVYHARDKRLSLLLALKYAVAAAYPYRKGRCRWLLQK
jgi:hypothetical protein